MRSAAEYNKSRGMFPFCPVLIESIDTSLGSGVLWVKTIQELFDLKEDGKFGPPKYVVRLMRGRRTTSIGFEAIQVTA